MGLNSHPVATTAFGADLLLAHRVLAAFESGRMPMHAGEFREISAWAFGAFRSLDAATLRDLAQNLHGPLKQIAQNVLFIHGDAEWASNPWDNRLAENAFAQLLGAMRAR
jgi:hypothetical protein